jgi:hypothetical protein
MRYTEFEQALAAGTINIGDEVWVVDFQYDDARKNPVRNVAPTRVRIVVFDDDAPDTWFGTIRQTKFQVVGHDGNLKNTVISRYSANRRFYINVFLTQDEAEDFYTQQCLEAKEKLEEASRLSHEKFMNSLQDVERRLQRRR